MAACVDFLSISFLCYRLAKGTLESTRVSCSGFVLESVARGNNPFLAPKSRFLVLKHVNMFFQRKSDARSVDKVCSRQPPRCKLLWRLTCIIRIYNHIHFLYCLEAIMVRGSELDIAVRASIVSLRFGAGLKSVEIASMLNIDPGTVRTTCYRMKRAAKSEDLLELLKHCRTKKRSGRPSMKNAADAATANANVNASPSAAEDDEDNQHEHEHEALGETAASTSPDPLAENFETTAWPERDLTAAPTANTNTNPTHSQPAPAHSQYQTPLPSETLPYTTLDPQLSTPQPSDPQQPQQWPPRKT